MYYPGYKECYESLEKILLLCFLTISWRYKGAIVESTREFDNRVVYNEQREKLSFFEKSSFFSPELSGFTIAYDTRKRGYEIDDIFSL